MVPWFLHKYKPWTVKDAEIRHLHLGRSPPVFTQMRVLQQSNCTDDLVLELGVNFLSADDMSAILCVKLRKLLGFGMWAKSHLVDMQIEGKVLVGFKFLPCWPFIDRLHVCFAGPPYSQIAVKPIFTHGLDVSEFPGIAGWIPNMLVVDVKKFCSPRPENWFFVDAKEPIAHATVEILEAADMKPADLNGLADPFVKGRLGPYRFRTKTQKKTLAPKWHEEFKIPICTWESPNILVIDIVDKDFFYNDTMGECSVSINEIRDGRRHEMWLPLKNINWGRLRLAVTVSECNKKRAEYSYDLQLFNDEFNFDKKRSLLRSSNILQKVDDEFEAMETKRKPRNRFRMHRHDEQALGDGHNSTRKLVKARALIHPTNVWKLIKSHRQI